MTTEIESNQYNGFLTEKEAITYLRKSKEAWGSNLVGWVEKKNERFFVLFNLLD